MKKLLLICALGAFVACNDNSSSSEAAKVDSTADAKKDKIDSTADAKKALVDSTAKKMKDTTKEHK